MPVCLVALPDAAPREVEQAAAQMQRKVARLLQVAHHLLKAVPLPQAAQLPQVVPQPRKVAQRSAVILRKIVHSSLVKDPNFAESRLKGSAVTLTGIASIISVCIGLLNALVRGKVAVQPRKTVPVQIHAA